MKQTKWRTLFYRRVAWVEKNKHDLEFYLKESHQAYTTTKERTFSYGDGEIQGLRAEEKRVGLFLHLAFYVPHQPTSLIQFPGDIKGLDPRAHPPPDKHNYLMGDIFVLCKENNLILCPSGARESIAQSYINHVLRKNGRQELTTRFSLEKVANIDKVRLLHEEGVKKVTLNASLYEATVGYVERKTIRKKLLNRLAEEFISIFAEDDEQLVDIRDRENLMVRVEISYDSRRKGGEVGRLRLESAADKLLTEDEDEGFSIITGTGKRITSHEIRLSEKVEIEAHGNSVSTRSAWGKLEKYLISLRDSGMLEQ